MSDMRRVRDLQEAMSRAARKELGNRGSRLSRALAKVREAAKRGGFRA